MNFGRYVLTFPRNLLLPSTSSDDIGVHGIVCSEMSKYVVSEGRSAVGAWEGTRTWACGIAVNRRYLQQAVKLFRIYQAR
jgi:hypothetical protein